MGFAHLLGVFIAAALLGTAQADLPVHCVHSQMLGEWSFHRGAGEKLKESLKCSQAPEHYDKRLDRWGLGEPNFDPEDEIKVELREPNEVHHVDADGVEHKGTWTMIYDEGFEVTIRGHKYFAFAYFKDGPRCDDSTRCMSRRSVCHVTFPGWYHNAKNPDGASWGCYYATKTQKGEEVEHTQEDTTELMQMSYQPEDDLVARINSDPHQTWKAKVYPEFLHKTMHQMHQMGGGKRYHPPAYLAGAFLEEGQGEPDPDVSDLPEQFDWRSHGPEGNDYIGPVMNQGSCGSCYTVAVTHMLEARLRIKTKLRHDPKLSIQAALACNEYAQGCHGGFPYLVGKYAQDFGMVDNAAQPYQGRKGVQCRRHARDKVRATDYGYVGGYYGACNHKKMLRELHDNGPIVVGFDTDAGLWHYSEGLYDADALIQEREQDHPQGWGEPHGKRLHNHWERTTHAVLVVGYGTGPAGKYWLVQNSWGPNWGERGYFKIKRGVDHCAFESMAVRATPVFGKDHYFNSKAPLVDELQYEPAAKAEKNVGETEQTESEDTKQASREEATSEADEGIDTPSLDIPVGRKKRLGESEQQQAGRPEQPPKRQADMGTTGWYSSLLKKVDHGKSSMNDLESQDVQDLNRGFEVPSFLRNSDDDADDDGQPIAHGSW